MINLVKMNYNKIRKNSILIKILESKVKIMPQKNRLNIFTFFIKTRDINLKK